MGVIDMVSRDLEKRQRCGYSYNDRYCNSGWNSYGRWILLGAIVVGAFLIFLLFSCITARRRRRMGHQPFYGTGWAAQGTPQYTNQGQYYNQQQQYQQQYQPPPPQYGAQGDYYNGYPKADGQQNGVELQQPSQAHYPQQGGDNVYQPPSGPPPPEIRR